MGETELWFGGSLRKTELVLPQQTYRGMNSSGEKDVLIELDFSCHFTPAPKRKVGVK